MNTFMYPVKYHIASTKYLRDKIFAVFAVVTFKLTANVFLCEFLNAKQQGCKGKEVFEATSKVFPQILTGNQTTKVLIIEYFVHAFSAS